MKINFPQRTNFVCTEFKISKQLSLKVGDSH